MAIYRHGDDRAEFPFDSTSSSDSGLEHDSITDFFIDAIHPERKSSELTSATHDDSNSLEPNSTTAEYDLESIYDVYSAQYLPKLSYSYPFTPSFPDSEPESAADLNLETIGREKKNPTNSTSQLLGLFTVRTVYGTCSNTGLRTVFEVRTT